MNENEHFAGIGISRQIHERDWLAIGVVIAAGALAACVLLAAVATFAGVRALHAHQAATLELNTTLRQLHLKNELAISELENREPRLQPSESPFESGENQ